MQQYDPLYFAVHGRRVVLAHGLGHGEHLDRNGPCAEGDGNMIADLHVIAGLGRLAARAGLPLTVTRVLSQASFATVRRLMRRETFRYLSSLMLSAFLPEAPAMCFCYHTANRRSVSTSGSALLSEDFAVDGPCSGSYNKRKTQRRICNGRNADPEDRAAPASGWRSAAGDDPQHRRQRECQPVPPPASASLYSSISFYRFKFFHRLPHSHDPHFLLSPNGMYRKSSPRCSG